MAESIKSNAPQGAEMGEGAECCNTPTSPVAIREHMDVIASCGKKIGVVDRVEGDSIKLTKQDSSDGQHHMIPKDWVARVDEHVHLNKTCSEAAREWENA